VFILPLPSKVRKCLSQIKYLSVCNFSWPSFSFGVRLCRFFVFLPSGSPVQFRFLREGICFSAFGKTFYLLLLALERVLKAGRKVVGGNVPVEPCDVETDDVPVVVEFFNGFKGNDGCSFLPLALWFWYCWFSLRRSVKLSDNFSRFKKNIANNVKT
jgi:hypothetical protein